MNSNLNLLIVITLLVALISVSANIHQSPLNDEKLIQNPRYTANHHPHHQSSNSTDIKNIGDPCSYNGFNGTCKLVDSCKGTSINQTTFCTGLEQCCIKQRKPSPGCGEAAIKRAMTWVNMKLQYCQSPNGEPD